MTGGAVIGNPVGGGPVIGGAVAGSPVTGSIQVGAAVAGAAVCVVTGAAALDPDTLAGWASELVSEQATTRIQTSAPAGSTVCGMIWYLR
ncbi:MAG TPA: hypothetical protein VLL08_18020 [Kineosporiaceae bacterium]|nr:hypothetical protein [Kineosporiaceae bacterium]